MTAQEILNTISYITLATCSKEGIPWATPVFTAFDAKYNFYWISPKDSLHSQNIHHNNNVSFVCFDSTAPKWTGVGIYATGKAYELTNAAEAQKGLDLVFARLAENLGPVGNYLGDDPYRVYLAKINHMWISVEKEIHGKTVDARELVDLDALVF